MFVEKDISKFGRLQQVLAKTPHQSSIKIEAYCSDFESRVAEWLASKDDAPRALAPTLVFVDPFGPSGFSMTLMHRILRYRLSEVLITLNLGAARRYFASVDNSDRQAALDTLYGCGNWRDCSSDDEYRLLYETQLRRADSRIFIRDFKMVNRQNQPSYYLVFATHDAQGLNVMKNAMWAVDRSGGFMYSDITNPGQDFLFDFDASHGIDYGRELLKLFPGRRVTKESLKEHTRMHPYYIDRHLTSALLWLTCDATPSVVADPPRRGNGWSTGTAFTFPPIE